jgi:hypothetical protein
MAKNYIKGSVRRLKSFEGEEPKLLASLHLEELAKIVNEKGYVNFIIAPRRETDTYGNTHYVYENDYKPTGIRSDGTPAGSKPAKSSSPTAKAGTPLKAPNFTENTPSDDLPF